MASLSYVRSAARRSQFFRLSVSQPLSTSARFSTSSLQSQLLQRLEPLLASVTSLPAAHRQSLSIASFHIQSVQLASLARSRVTSLDPHESHQSPTLPLRSSWRSCHPISPTNSSNSGRSLTPTLPNHALPRTASFSAFSSAMQPIHQPPQSLNLGSLGVARASSHL